MPSNLTPSGELINKSFKLVQEQWKSLWMWLAGFAVLQFVTTYWITQLLPSRTTMMGPSIGPSALGSQYSFLLGVVVIGSILVEIGLLRELLFKAMPAGTKILGFWMSVVELILSGIIAGILTFAGLIVFIIPGIWLAVSFSFARYEIIANGKGVWSGIVSSFNLVKGRWWATFGRSLLGGLFAFLLNLGGILIIGIVSIILSAIGLTSITTVVAELLRSLVLAYVVFFATCWVLNLYQSLRSTPVPTPAAPPATKN